jgi:hypothetical protein
MKEEKERLERIGLCKFQRDKESPWEYGLSCNYGRLGIIDQFGNRIKKVLHCSQVNDSFYISPHDNAFTFQLPQNESLPPKYSGTCVSSFMWEHCGSSKHIKNKHLCSDTSSTRDCPQLRKSKEFLKWLKENENALSPKL